ncbi:heparan-alpha-glucosaminide N-acetyltransferase isoform X2 [Prunus yedoensis var. nudiflora]|uniref:Heparan-alpha-glucosaminide N-acetyltransferase isoform X2 n=1 Tax=Prunus yedoensis var. nudiflora TaxID=2094558 RepID=A0A315ALD2_PRUYE|nr:heparan-alpha-glucosaminide N-acetyltransferase isoform X2 [Prunus yedoensis var. nudiflora]
MSAAVDVAPLLLPYRDRDTDRGSSNEIQSLVPSVPSNGPDASTPSQRLASLDVFRGLTVALMILVDDAGGAFPSINHSPWFGITLADFVMPFFLFLVGVSISLAFKIRWLGVLQRISIGYLLASISEIWLVNNIMVDSLADFAWKYYTQWLFAIGLCSLYMCFLMNLSGFASGTQIVYCGVRGSLEPPCNAVGFIDRVILGEHHLYQHPVYRRTKECSVKSPDYGPLPPNSPQWCLAPFDPEGILSSLMAAVTCFVGLHFGHILLHFKDQKQRVLLWSMSAVPLLLFGYVLVILGIPSCKPLYTVSYACITAGVSGLILSIIFYIVDVKHFRKPTVLLQWMGMNALLIYALGACDLFSAGLQGFYWRSPENNLVDGTEALLQAMLQSKNWGTLAFVILEILFWGLVSGFLHMKSLYIRL